MVLHSFSGRAACFQASNLIIPSALCTLSFQAYFLLLPSMWCLDYCLWLHLCYSCRWFLLHEMHILHSCRVCVYTALLHILHALLLILLVTTSHSYVASDDA